MIPAKKSICRLMDMPFSSELGKVKWGQSSRINMKGVSWTGSVLNGANLRAVWGQIRVSRRSLWNEGLDADKARRMDVSITSHRRFGSDPQLFDFLPNFIKLAPFGSVLAW
jgi:hypothetical protein